ncbi:MAG TPA: hypothetical protein VGP41_02695 [Candidatus Lustribacter sp.]|nr:hypothetical protein [Candidatus Lustribacter sp.]
MKTKVAAAFDDPVARFAVAVPSAVVITALCFALGRCQPADRTLPESAPPQTVVLERAAPTPPPTPRPPTPTPPPPTPPPLARVTLAPIPQRAAPRAVKASGGGHAAPRPHPQVVTPAVIVAGSGGGAGTGQGSGEGAGTAGGSGNGTGDTGSGSVNAQAPCGSVDLVPFQAPDHSGPLTYEHVNATVTFPDRHTESDNFPYRWVYADPDSDPWSPRNLPNPNFSTHVQLPPSGTDTSRYPEVIRYILNHTRADGTTILQECPR